MLKMAPHTLELELHDQTHNQPEEAFKNSDCHFGTNILCKKVLKGFHSGKKDNHFPTKHAKKSLLVKSPTCLNASFATYERRWIFLTYSIFLIIARIIIFVTSSSSSLLGRDFSWNPHGVSQDWVIILFLFCFYCCYNRFHYCYYIVVVIVIYYRRPGHKHEVKCRPARCYSVALSVGL